MRDVRRREKSLIQSKTKALIRTGPKLDRDRSGPFCGTDGLGSVWCSDLRSVFALPYSLNVEMILEEEEIKRFKD